MAPDVEKADLPAGMADRLHDPGRAAIAAEQVLHVDDGDVAHVSLLEPSREATGIDAIVSPFTA
jgi:hypothetical protein